MNSILNMLKIKRVPRMALSGLGVFALLFGYNGMANTTSAPTSNGGITPYIFSVPGPGGNMTCEALGYAATSERVNYNNGSFDKAFPDGITVDTNGTYVSWSSANFPIDAVIVKGSDAANIYEYDPASYSDSELASPINSSGNPAGLSNLTFCWTPRLKVSKTAETSFTRTWAWDIEKILVNPADGKLLLAKGQSFDAEYKVVLSVLSKTDSDFAVTGVITIENPSYNGLPATITSVYDVISDDIEAYVDCSAADFSLDAGQTTTCTYYAELPDASSRLNTATVETSGAVKGSNGTADVVFGSDPSLEVDECVYVDDSLVGDLGQVCANDANKTIEYKYTITAPTDSCELFEVTNVASFVTGDTEAYGDDLQMIEVEVACEQGCSLTQGYWKTHNEYRAPPDDATWYKLEGGLGPNTMFFNSGKTWYEVFWTAPAGNAYYNLAHQYMAAVLNGLNGADTSSMNATLAAAKTLFENNTPAQVEALKGKAKENVTTLAGILGSYNEGTIGPGHCDEDSSSAK